MKDLKIGWLEATDAVEALEDGIVLEHFVCDRDVPEMEAISDIFGTPEKDALVWSKAGSALSDQAMCEKYAVEQLNGQTPSEHDVLSELEARGYHNREYGSVRAALGCFAEAVGLKVSYETDLSLHALCESLESDEKIICSVSSIALLFPELANMPGLSPDRAVEVIGIDAENPDETRVILNDPLSEAGGSAVNYDVFHTAWEKSGCFAAIVSASEG